MPPYTLTVNDIESITPEEFTRGTARLLPVMRDIPFSIRNGHGPYYALAQAMMYGEPLPDSEVTNNPGYPESSEFIEAFQRCLIAHLCNIDTDHDDRIKGVAVMLSKVFTLTEE
jgi:hypothetical protein